jgi:hypothetical protein
VDSFVQKICNGICSLSTLESSSEVPNRSGPGVFRDEVSDSGGLHVVDAASSR